ncbi:MAG: type II toxin-antitoxin system Phd/YefM family antitoxin [Gemmatimonadales bacterium]
MKIVTMHDAKTNLSRIVEEARAGAEIVIARGKMPLVRLVPVDQPPAKRQFGALRGQFRVPASFFDPLPGEELQAWGE